MIKELYIDNFKCFSNSTVTLGQFQLWLGNNGVGKTSALKALKTIQRILTGASVLPPFLTETTLTAWDKREMQTFRLKMSIANDLYEYELQIKYERGSRRCKINKESLSWNGSLFFLFDGEDAHLYRINNTSKQVEEGTHFTADWTRSIIPSIAERQDNAPLIKFRNEVQRWLMVHPVPMLMNQIAEDEDSELSEYAENIAAWYRNLVQEDPGIIYETQKALRDVIPGFQELSLKTLGDVRKLTAKFKFDTHPEIISFDFNELSDGQRQLILLHLILELVKKKKSMSVFIDEPDNYISIREIQPWLKALEDACLEYSAQAVIISHNGEIINQMTHGNELYFQKKDSGQIEISSFPVHEGLTAAETMARGW